MGLTKQYLRYVGAEVFSVVGSAKSNVTFLDIGGYSDRFCAVGACENVILWDMRKGEKVHLTQRSSKACKQIMFPPPTGGRHCFWFRRRLRHRRCLCYSW